MACEAAPSSEDLGATRSTPIVGGTEDNGDPAVFEIFTSEDGTNPKTGCTGSLIAPKVILTAAHCVHSKALGFKPKAFFAVNAKQALSVPANQRLAVERAVANPSFAPGADGSSPNDVAVIILKQALTIKPIAINHDSIDDANGATARIVGYGITSDGDTASANTKRAATVRISKIAALSFLVGDGKTTQCHGDSGGPVFMNMDGETRIIGLSWRTVDAQGSCSAAGSLATRVDKVSAFIDTFLDGDTPGTGTQPSPGTPDPDEATSGSANGDDDDDDDDDDDVGVGVGGGGPVCNLNVVCTNGVCICGPGPNAGKQCQGTSCTTLCRQCN
jgi:secreted trypsin-like serine protease